MSLSYPPLLVLGLLVVAALIVGAVLAGRRRTAALAAAGVSVAGRQNRRLGLWLVPGWGRTAGGGRGRHRPRRCRWAAAPAR